MSDIVWGLALLTGFTAAFYALGGKLGRTLSVRLARSLAIATTLVIAAYIAFLYDDVLLAKLLPVSNLIVVGNWIPPLTGFLAGLAWSLIPRPSRRAVRETAPPIGSDSSGDRSWRTPGVETGDWAERLLARPASR